MRVTTTMQSTFMGLPIQAYSERGLACREDILSKIHALMLYGLSKGRRMFTRFDLRFPVNYNASICNGDIQKFFNSFTVNLKRKGLDPQYLWVREKKGRENRQHYHCILLTKATDSVDKQFKDHWNLLVLAEKVWGKVLGIPDNHNNGLVNFCKSKNDADDENDTRNGLMLYQNDVGGEGFRKAFNWASYLAKENQKGYAQGYNEWGYSQIPAEFRRRNKKQTWG